LLCPAWMAVVWRVGAGVGTLLDPERTGPPPPPLPHPPDRWVGGRARGGLLSLVFRACPGAASSCAVPLFVCLSGVRVVVVCGPAACVGRVVVGCL